MAKDTNRATNGHPENLCRRCKESAAVIVVRTEPLCQLCFIRYVRTKIVKRMEAFRPKMREEGQQRKLLIPISFGVSSITLLQVLDAQLANQKEKTGRYGYELVIVHVTNNDNANSSSHGSQMEALKARFPNYDFHVQPLQNISSHGLTNEPEQGATSPNIMDNILSPTGREDVYNILRLRTIADFAMAHGCEGILWGDSTTKLAERTIAETAKGRGFSLPWNVSDGTHPSGISFIYPIRDLLKKELISYSEMIEHPLTDLIVPLQKVSSVITKNTTIDDLMANYFGSVEENFPSIVANVVRTTSRLDAPKSPSNAATCDLCKLPSIDGSFGIHGWGGDQGGESQAGTSSLGNLCYGCTRSVPT